MLRLMLIILLFSFVARADEIHVDARLLCTANAALLQFTTAANDTTPAFPDLNGMLAAEFSDAQVKPGLECDLGGPTRPRMLRAKVGSTQPHHWGMCGGLRKHFFSLWVDGHKIFSRKFFHNLCAPTIHVGAVAYWDSTLLLCGYRHGWDEVLQTDRYDQPPAFTCLDVSETYRAAITEPVDLVEYPDDGSPRREGHIILIRSVNRELCDLLHQSFSLGQNFAQVQSASDFEDIPWPWFDPINVEVDIDNDGLKDIIRMASEDHHGVDQFIVMVRDGRDRDRLSDPPATFDQEEIPSGDSLFPHSRTVYGDARAMGRSIPIVIDPFLWRGETFVMMQTYITTQSPKWAVYQLRPDRTVNEICVLDRMPINY